MSLRPLAQGHRKLMAQHQNLDVLPPRCPPRQAQHRYGPGHDEEDQLQAHKPKIIALQPEPDLPARHRPRGRGRRRDAKHLPRWRRFSAPTGSRRSRTGGSSVLNSRRAANPKPSPARAARCSSPRSSPGRPSRYHGQSSWVTALIDSRELLDCLIRRANFMSRLPAQPGTDAVLRATETGSGRIRGISGCSEASSRITTGHP